MKHVVLASNTPAMTARQCGGRVAMPCTCKTVISFSFFSSILYDFISWGLKAMYNEVAGIPAEHSTRVPNVSTAVELSGRVAQERTYC